MPELPSGLKLYISKLSIIDFQGRTDWFRCPADHFWFMTPNITASPPPYFATDEIVLDFLSAPVPTTHHDAAQFVHIYLEDPVLGIFWRGDWLDTFQDSLELSKADSVFWQKWIRENDDFLDDTIADCERQAASNQSMTGSYESFPGEYTIHMRVPAHSVCKELIPARIEPYELSQLMERKHKLPESVKQLDYEAAANYVAADLQDHGYNLVSAEKNRMSSPSLIVQSRSGRMAIRVIAARAPGQATFSDTAIAELKARSPLDVNEYGFACVGLLPTTPRTPEGDSSFYMKYEGLEKV